MTVIGDLLSKKPPLVKICGLQTVEAAKQAIDSGTDLLGIICVPNRKRTVQPEIAKGISALVRNDSNTHLVGVFRNQSKEEVLAIATEYNVDIVQLHGDEDWVEYSEFIQKPMFKRFIFPTNCENVIELTNSKPSNCLPLFDSEAGGTGELLDWTSIANWVEGTGKPLKYMLAGGLTPSNVGQAVKLTGVIGVDVSGGVETDNAKDLSKITHFIRNAKQ